MEEGDEEMKSRNWEGLRRNWPSGSACLWMGAWRGGELWLEFRWRWVLSDFFSHSEEVNIQTGNLGSL